MSDTELLHEPKGEPVRRVEVFSGAGRRRRWGAEHKARIVAESYGRGETVSGVARRHGLTAQQLFGWRRVMRQQAEHGAERSGVGFAPVVVDAGQPFRDELISPAVSGRPPAIEIVIGAATVRIPFGIDSATLGPRIASTRLPAPINLRCPLRNVPVYTLTAAVVWRPSDSS
jgi:transposase